MNRTLTALAAASFLACIVAANITTSTYGMQPVGFGLTATAGTWFAGATFLLRDVIHDRSGPIATVQLIIAGAALSLIMADPRIALASVAAFLLSELADLAVYTPLRRHGYLRAAFASNIVGAILDTVLFLAIAGFPVLPAVPGQLVAKLSLTGAALAVVGVTRAVLREPVES